MIPSIILILIATFSSIIYYFKNRFYSEGKTEKIDSIPSFSYVYRYIQVSTVIISLLAFNSDNKYLLKIHESTIMLCTGLTISILGFVIFGLAIRSLGTHYSPCYDSFVPVTFNDKGVYAYIRHPIYAGNIILLFGLFIASGSIWVALNVVIVIYYYMKSATIEEAILSEKLTGYRDYCEKSYRFLPFIY